MRTSFLLALALCAGPLWGQEVFAPKSAIDWLNDVQPAPVTPLAEPNVSKRVDVPQVTTNALRQRAPIRLGLTSAASAGLPDNLWAGTDGFEVAEQLEAMPRLTVPAAQNLLFRVLVAEAAPALKNPDKLHVARINALVALGAIEPAFALLEAAGPTATPAHFELYANLSLLQGNENRACRQLMAAPHLSQNEALRVFCLARGGDWDTAALVFGTSAALGLFDELEADALARFLDPELFEGEADLPVPQKPDALLFRLYEALGQSIPTRALPLVFAYADLSERAGWKAQLDAAERLVQTGAISPNKLLGVYSDRRPAASGALWDRVAAVQRAETALRSQNADAIAKTLPRAWQAVKEAKLALPFAAVFADEMGDAAFVGAAAKAAYEILLLSDEPDAAITRFPELARQNPVHRALVRNVSVGMTELTPIEIAVVTGRPKAPEMVGRDAEAVAGRLGLALLETLSSLQAGADGDVAQLRTALERLCRLGFEEVAQRAALQISVLGANS